MLHLLSLHGEDATREHDLLEALQDENRAAQQFTGRGDREQVGMAESAIRAAPAEVFHFDAGGGADLTAGGRTWRAGRFEAVSLGRLRSRLPVPTSSGRFTVLGGRWHGARH